MVRPAIAAPRSAEDWDAARQLCREYRAHLMTLPPEHRAIVETFYPEARYAEILTRLEEMHVPPRGGLLLAQDEGVPLGCGMFHSLEPGVAEIKRVYLRPEARGGGTGRALMEALVAEIRALGFTRIVMDTAGPLTAARRLYHAMGFEERGPYAEVPPDIRPLLHFFEMRLTD